MIFDRAVYFVQDNQGYGKTLFLVSTNCRWGIMFLEELSNRTSFSRFSQDCFKFCEELQKYGYRCKVVKKIGDYEGMGDIEEKHFKRMRKSGFIMGSMGSY